MEPVKTMYQMQTKVKSSSPNAMYDKTFHVI